MCLFYLFVMDLLCFSNKGNDDELCIFTQSALHTYILIIRHFEKKIPLPNYELSTRTQQNLKKK